MLGGAGSPGSDELLTVTVVRDEHGYGMKVSGDNPVYVQSVKEGGAAWRAGLRAGDRILRVDGVPVHHHTHQQVVHMIRANPTTVLTVHQNASRHKTPITAPVPVNSEKQRQLEASKVQTVRLMLDQEQKYMRDLRHELSKVPDVRKQAQLESAEQRCSILQHQIDTILVGQPQDMSASYPQPAPPATPRLPARIKHPDKLPGSPPPNTAAGFLSGLPRSLSNLTGQSLRNLRQARQNSQKNQQENQPPLVRQNSDENHKKRHNNTVPMVPTTCLDNTPPPPLPPRSIERPKRPLNPNSPVNPLAKPKPMSPTRKPYYKGPYYYDNRAHSPMHQSMPAPYREDNPKQLRRSSHSLDSDLDGPQPNSIALQMNYPLVNAPPPPLKTDNRTSIPVLHVRSQSSPEQLDHGLHRFAGGQGEEKEPWERGTPPPGTPPPPYAHNTQPCADPQRAIISMEEDDPPSDNSTYSGLFSNLNSVRESKARTAVLLNWLLAERRCACANLLLVLTDGYRAAAAVTPATLRRWAYEIHSTFLIPNAVLQLNGVDENMANEIEHVLVNEYEKEELLRNVFRKARQKAKEELAQQLSEFQVKRQVGLATLYGPEDALIQKCDSDKAQEAVVVERLMCAQLSSVAARGGAGGNGGSGGEAHAALLAALQAAALTLHCRPASVSAAVGGSRPSFLVRDKPYKQRLKQIAKQNPQPFVVRGHHLQLQALTSVAHCHHCDNVIWGLAPQAYVCTDCNLRVHRACAKRVEEPCCLDEHHNNRISRFMERIHHNQNNNQELNDKKSKKASGTAHFLNVERSVRRIEDEPTCESSPTHLLERRDESDESLYESADCHSDAISASDDALPRLGKTPTISKESLKLAVTDEEVDFSKNKKGHRKAMSLSNPLELVKHLGDEWLESRRDFDKKKSRESLWSEEDRESIYGSNMKLDQIRKNSKKDNKSQSNSRKSSTVEPPKSRKISKGSTVSLNFLKRKKTPTSTIKPVEAVEEVVDKVLPTDEVLHYTKYFLEEEKRYASACEEIKTPPEETDSDDEPPSHKPPVEHRRRLSRQTSRSKSKVRGKSQTVRVNTLRKSHSGTLKKAKKKGSKTPMAGRSRQSSIVEATPLLKKKSSISQKQNSWLFSGSRGESRREGSADEQAAPEPDVDSGDAANNLLPDRDYSSRLPSGGGRGVNRAESCRERDAPRRGKHRNASDPNRLTKHNNHDLEPGAATAPSGSSSSSSLSSRSNESNTVAADHQASQSDWSEEDEPLAAQWADSLPPQVLDSLLLPARLRKRQEVIHELITSEASHVRWLKVLGFVFLQPLESQPLLLPPEELRALFPNLPGVRERHTKLYSDLKAVRNEATNHIVQIRPIADAMLNTLGDSGYAGCLSRFCRGQRMALEALRERRRKNKELHQFLASKEQMPLCGRLQLRDLLACVWQRLTKYQLLLESILKTVEDSDSETEEDVSRLRHALDVAKDVLHSVDTAIRTAENQHRLRTIQNKLEVRASGAEWEELRRLDLTQRALKMEGELSIRCDSTKKINLLALMLSDSLVLLQREGDKFILKPITQPSQQGLLSPLIKWDKVLFRPNAAARNTFFLMNINGVHLHELSANTAAEYATWVKNIQDCPLAMTELKPIITPSHHSTKSNDDSGINVSRNPSDASEKSSSTAAADENESERDRASLERSSIEREERPESEEKKSVERERQSQEKEGVVTEREERHKPRRPTMGRISQHAHEPPPPLLEPSAAVIVHDPAATVLAHTAQRAYTHHERLRKLDESIARAMRAKSAVVAELLGVDRESIAQVADLAVAETLGQLDMSSEMHAARLDRSNSMEEELPPYTDEGGQLPPAADMHQLLLAAQAQANQLTEALTKALTVSESSAIAARVRSGRCDNCRRRHLPRSATIRPDGDQPEQTNQMTDLDEKPLDRSIEKEVSFDMLSELDSRTEGLDDFERSASAAGLASTLVGVTSGLQSALGRLLASVPSVEAERRALRAELVALREANDALRARNRIPDYEMTEEMCFPREHVDHAIQDQPSNGG